jgi:NADH dehydrogenase
LFIGDILLTPEEVQGLMSDLLISNEPPRGRSKFSEWLVKNKGQVGVKYASELKRHFI